MTALAALPPLHQSFQGIDPTQALRDLRGVVEHEITHEPRSLQTAIGPSEIGTPCDHCLAAKLAGWEQHRDVAWLPTVGTAVHRLLEEYVIRHENNLNAQHTTGRRWLLEQPTMVGHIAGVEIWGSTDVVDLAAGMTVDWKIVGASTLKQAKTGPSATYRVQADLYAKGWNDAGVRIDHVAIAYLPRNAVSLNDAIWWTAPHDRARAETALARADALARNLGALELISTHVRDQWISNLPRADRCFDCPRFADGTGMTTPGHRPPEAPFADLLGTPQ